MFYLILDQCFETPIIITNKGMAHMQINMWSGRIYKSLVLGTTYVVIKCKYFCSFVCIMRLIVSCGIDFDLQFFCSKSKNKYRCLGDHLCSSYFYRGVAPIFIPYWKSTGNLFWRLTIYFFSSFTIPTSVTHKEEVRVLHENSYLKILFSHVYAIVHYMDGSFLTFLISAYCLINNGPLLL